MTIKNSMLVSVCLAAAMAFSGAAHADRFPSKPVKIVVPYSPGGGTDLVARMLAEKLQGVWGQPVIIENRAGAGGNLGAAAVFGAAPDGYTLLFTAQGPLVVNKSLYADLAYEPDAFVPVSLVTVAYSVLLVNPKMSAKSVQELIAFAKANPGRLNYASQGIGTAAHLTAELFKSMAGVNIVHIPYKGTGPALTALVAGQVDMMFGELAAAKPYISADKLRALAVSSEKRNPSLPNVPAMSEVLPGFVVTSWWAIVAPPGTPSGVANSISHAIAASLKQRDIAKRLADMSMVPSASTPAELRSFIKQESKRWGAVIRAAGVKPQ